MIELALIGIGTGNPDHLTLQAVREIGRCDVILLPLKGDEKSELAEIRRAICDRFRSGNARIAEFVMPVRDEAIPDYRARVEAWHKAIAQKWSEAIAASSAPSRDADLRVGLLVWGDPSLYDSTMRIAERLGEQLPVRVEIIPGITSLQMLTAVHAIPANEVGQPFMVTTGRQIRDSGFPEQVDTVFVMLDGECSFMHLPPADFDIWWGAFLGMPGQVVLSGSLEHTRDRIVAGRALARKRAGWVMDSYMLRRRRN